MSEERGRPHCAVGGTLQGTPPVVPPIYASLHPGLIALTVSLPASLPDLQPADVSLRVPALQVHVRLTISKPQLALPLGACRTSRGSKASSFLLAGAVSCDELGTRRSSSQGAQCRHSEPACNPWIWARTHYLLRNMLCPYAHHYAPVQLVLHTV